MSLRKTPARALALTAALLTPAALASLAPPQPAEAADNPEPVLDPKALTALDQMKTYLRSLKSFSIQATLTRDEVVGDQFKIQRNNTASVDVVRPDRLRAELLGSQGDRQWVYDGQKFHVLAKTENYYASLATPPTLLAALDAVIDEHDLEVPLLDVVYTAMGGELAPHITAAGALGPDRIDGVDCDHYAYRADKVDFQFWVERGPKPVPRKLVVTTRDQDTQPQYSALMRWNTEPKLDPASFKFTPPQGALPMQLGGPAPAETPAKKAPKP
jgi:hypothetical protein